MGRPALLHLTHARVRVCVCLPRLPAGYALTIFIPVSMACVIPVEWLRWVVIMGATVLSGGFLLRNFKNAIFAAAPAK